MAAIENRWIVEGCSGEFLQYHLTYYNSNIPPLSKRRVLSWYVVRFYWKRWYCRCYQGLYWNPFQALASPHCSLLSFGHDYHDWGALKWNLVAPGRSKLCFTGHIVVFLLCFRYLKLFHRVSTCGRVTFYRPSLKTVLWHTGSSVTCPDRRTSSFKYWSEPDMSVVVLPILLFRGYQVTFVVLLKIRCMSYKLYSRIQRGCPIVVRP